MDNLYRLQRAVGAGYGTLNYDYDRLGNMALAASPNIPDPDVNIGVMESGQYLSPGAGQSGTTNRIGREPGDAPGPHALTFADNGADQRSFTYDANGNMTNNNGDVYTFDFKDRLGDVDVADQPAPDIRYLYDYSGRRVIKRVDGNQTSYINKYSEIRDGEMIKYVWNGDQRLAQVTGGMPEPPTVTQRISLRPEWNAISFQVVPESNEPSFILESIEEICLAVFGWDGVAFEQYRPGSASNTLESLSPNLGYWFEMTDSTELVLSGPVATAPIAIDENRPTFIGFPRLVPTVLSGPDSNTHGISVAWAYDNNTGHWDLYESSLPIGLNSLYATPAGNAVWVWTDQSTVLLPDLPSTGSLTFFHPDHRGSTHFLSSATGILSKQVADYPFGLSYLDEGLANCEYRFGGKEHDNESGLTYQVARSYFAPLCRFISWDPAVASNKVDLLIDPSDLNPYSFVANRPIDFTDPTGFAKFRVFFRSFAPFERFGSVGPLNFHGDNRKASTDFRATSRIDSRVTIDTKTGKMSNQFTQSSPTVAYLGNLPIGVDIQNPEFSANLITNSSNPNQSMLILNQSAANPLIPLSPDIDKHALLEITETTIGDKTLLTIRATVYGDAFPASELFITDAAGNAIGLGSFSPDASLKDLGPFMLLPGDQKRFEFSTTTSIIINKDGVFEGVLPSIDGNEMLKK
ncbi:MAG: hypothetical protein IPK83_21385 [Planctomycetes bacterium]|nr:hypothetical protein [Planctomycetota bacterium]